MSQRFGAASGKNSLTRLGVVCGLLLVGALTVSLGGWQVDKPPTPLRGQLKDIPLILASHYIAEEGRDRTMSREQEDVLQTKLYLLRTYVDEDKSTLLKKAASGSAEERAARVGRTLALNLNYYENGGSDTHVPDVCWTGSGMEPNYDDSGELKLEGVVLADGSKIDVPVKLVAFKPTTNELRAHPDWAGKESEHLLFVAYTFNVNGEYVAHRELLPQKFWQYSDDPFLYHAKVEVTVNERCTAAEARPVLEAFFRAVLPEVVKKLPDYKELKAAEAAAKNKK
jgi:hypothetical protein